MVYSSDSTKAGVITSPGYPSAYQARTNCRYEFLGRGKERIQIVFHEFMLNQMHGDTNKDTKEWVFFIYVKSTLSAFYYYFYFSYTSMYIYEYIKINSVFYIQPLGAV